MERELHLFDVHVQVMCTIQEIAGLAVVVEGLRSWTARSGERSIALVGSHSLVSVIVNVPPAEDEQAARVPKTGDQEKRRAQAG